MPTLRTAPRTQVAATIEELDAPIAAAEAESESSDEENTQVMLTGSAAKQRLRRPGSRKKQWMAAILMGVMSTMSLLEFCSVAGATSSEYQRQVRALEEFAEQNGLALQVDTPSTVEATMVSYFNHLFQQGVHANVAEKTVAGWMYQNPSYSRHGSSTIPRVWKCLRGWRLFIIPRLQKNAEVGSLGVAYVLDGVARLSQHGDLCGGVSGVLLPTRRILPADGRRVLVDGRPAGAISLYHALSCDEGPHEQNGGAGQRGFVGDRIAQLPSRSPTRTPQNESKDVELHVPGLLRDPQERCGHARLRQASAVPAEAQRRVDRRIRPVPQPGKDKTQRTRESTEEGSEIRRVWAAVADLESVRRHREGLCGILPASRKRDSERAERSSAARVKQVTVRNSRLRGIGTSMAHPSWTFWVPPKGY